MPTISVKKSLPLRDPLDGLGQSKKLEACYKRLLA